MDLLRDFLDWWLRQLVALVPLRTIQFGFSTSHGDVVEIVHDEATLLLRQHGRLTTVATASFTDPQALRALISHLPGAGGAIPQVVVRLSAAAVLRKNLSVPTTARWHMEKVLAFELDHETPFTADEAYWAYAISGHDRTRKRLDVELVILTRSEIDPLVATIRRAGAEVIGIEISTSVGKPLFVPLQEGKRHHRLLGYRPLLGRAGAAIGLAAVAAVVPFAQLHFARKGADRTIAALTTNAEEAGSLRKAVDQLTGAATYLTEERQRTGPALAVLASITNDLPDDTHLMMLSLHSGHVTIQGLAQSAARVVAEISKDPKFTDQVFDSPVVQDSKSGLESFTLSFALKSAGP
jgi:general secretion pathway protein L